jgi:hypothetical protein
MISFRFCYRFSDHNHILIRDRFDSENTDTSKCIKIRNSSASYSGTRFFAIQSMFGVLVKDRKGISQEVR